MSDIFITSRSHEKRPSIWNVGVVTMQESECAYHWFRFHVFRLLLDPGDKTSFFSLKPIQVDNISTNDDICIFIVQTYRHFEELIFRSRIIGGSRNYHLGQFNSNEDVVHPVDVDCSSMEKHSDKSSSIEALELVEQLCEQPELAASKSIEQATNEHHDVGDACLHPVEQSASNGRVIDLEDIDHLAMKTLRDSLREVETLDIMAKRYVRTKPCSS